VIVFLHIPKTAGTSLVHLLSKKFAERSLLRIYAPEQCRLSHAQLAELITPDTRCISGHIPYGIHEATSQSCQYFSMVRNPLDRVVSHYYFTRSQDPETHPLREVIQFCQSHSIVEFLEAYPHVVYEQIYLIGGDKTTGPVALETALDKVQSSRVKVGLTEDYFRSSHWLFQELGLGNPSFPIRRKNRGSARQQLDKKTENQVRLLCQDDLKLYDAVVTQQQRSQNAWRRSTIGAVAKCNAKIFDAYCGFRQTLSR